jgi:hypothetical protein
MTTTPPNLNLELSIALAILILGTAQIFIFRLAVQIVAGFTPGFWRAYWALFGSGVVIFAVAKAASAAGLLPRDHTSAFLAILGTGAVLRIVIIAALITAPNGDSLGFLRAIGAYIIQYIIIAVMFFIIGFASVMAFGPKPARAFTQAYFARLNKYSAFAIVTGTSSNSAPLQTPSIQGLLFPGNTPAAQDAAAPAARYFLTTSVVVPVPYGSMTIPPRTEVRVLNQNGDSYQVQAENNQFTVTRSQLVIAP